MSHYRHPLRDDSRRYYSYESRLVRARAPRLLGVWAGLLTCALAALLRWKLVDGWLATVATIASLASLVVLLVAAAWDRRLRMRARSHTNFPEVRPH